MNLKQVALGLALVAITSISAVAQCKQQIWPEQKAKAEECVAIFGDAVRQGHFRNATASLQWMMTNAPNWNTKLYVDAATAYDGLASQEKDPAKKKVLVDSLMLIYDLRLKNCGDEINVLNRKAAANVKYNINNKEKAAELLALYDRVYEISGNNVNDNNLEAYISVVFVNFITQKNLPEAQKTLTEDQILARYDKLIEVIDAKIAKSQQEGKTADADKYKAIKANVDDKLIKMIKVDCKFVKAKLESKFKANPKDIVLAKKIFKFMLEDNCAEDPLWLEAALTIHEVEKDCGLAKNLGKRFISTDPSKAEGFFKEAQSLCNDPNDKSDILILLGVVESKKGSKINARELFKQAIIANPSNKDAYEKIGDLYMNSCDDCCKRVSQAEDRLIYLAAFDMYAKAGKQDKMKAARGQFPSVTELFELNWKEGETKRIEKCWVGETVTLRTRGKE